VFLSAQVRYRFIQELKYHKQMEYLKKECITKWLGIGIVNLLFLLPLTSQEIKLDKAQECLNQSILAYKKLKYEECRIYALKALEFNPNLGEAYIVVGQAYIASKDLCFPNEYDIKSIMFCLAVDKFELAKKVDSSITDRANELIRVYSKYFPSREEIWSNIRSGEKYKIGCWINEETTIRFYEDIYK
jgi:tetratricopeptide (TPR) repeat protein